MSALLHKLHVLKRMVFKNAFKTIGTVNGYIQPKMSYEIKKGYHHASRIEHHDARLSTDEFQPSVYELAADISEKHGFRSIVDVGCGSGYKLVHRLGKFETIGLETEPAYSWLLEKYPDRKWLRSEEVDPTILKPDLVICCDVIEHIEHPDTMMDFLQKINFRYLILSTPERDRVAGKSDYGPPQNVFHYREWNAEEFKAYAAAWFRIEVQHIFQDKSITQALVCTKK